MDINSSVSGISSMLVFANTLAYIDPGTGALIWQLLLATAVGGLFYARSYLRRLLSIFQSRKGAKKSDEQPF